MNSRGHGWHPRQAATGAVDDLRYAATGTVGDPSSG